MAVVFPPNWEKYVANKSEEFVVRQLLNAFEEDENTFILANVMRGPQHLEFDQIIICEAGVLVIETKGYRTLDALIGYLDSNNVSLEKILYKRITNIREQLLDYPLEDDSTVGLGEIERVFIGGALALPNMRFPEDQDVKEKILPFYSIIDEGIITSPSLFKQAVLKAISSQRKSKKLYKFSFVQESVRNKIFEILSSNINSIIHDIVQTKIGISFLEPEQRIIVDWQPENPDEVLMVYGVPGSGKTVIAIHRAIEMSRKLKESVLYVCYNEALRDSVKDVLRREGITGDIEVKSIYAIAEEIVRQIYPGMVVVPEEIFARQLSLRCNAHPDRISLELKWLAGNNFVSLDEYIENKRVGAYPLDLGIQEIIFEEFFNFRQQAIEKCKDKEGCEIFYSMLPTFALRILREEPDLLNCVKRYKHIIVDEGQDFSPESLKLMKVLLQNGGDMIFLYDRSQSMFTFGVDYYECFVKMGFSPINEVLTVNFRSPQEIVNLAKRVYKDPVLQRERKEFKETYLMRSKFQGKKPVVKAFQDREAEIKFIKQKVKEHTKKNRDVAVLTLTQWWKEELEKNLKEYSNVTVSTMQKLKGLEFDVVIISGLVSGYESHKYPKEILSMVSRSINVAITRAENYLYITYSGEIHPALKIFMD